MSHPEIWLLCGSQHLYGAEPLEVVHHNAQAIAQALSEAPAMPLPVRFKGLVTRPEEARRLCLAASSAPECAGVIVWMHTFSPAKMWITGLMQLTKPLCHLHTQFHRELPWESIDMDFMNLHQAAHGDREAGFLHSRLRLKRKVVAGHWSDPALQQQLGSWARAAYAWYDLQGARFARFGDNMRQVAVTEGDKVAAEARFGFSVDGYGVGELVEAASAVSERAVDALIDAYRTSYRVAPELLPGGARHAALRDEARLELGLRSFLQAGGFKGFTTTFEDLHGLNRLPGLAVQRLMAEGYGFGAEGDWKSAALVRAMKQMGATCSFMEDYTYHLDPHDPQVLGAHMLELCPSIAADVPSLEIHPLSIGGKADPLRLVFNAKPGQALNVALIDLGNRFRLIANAVEVGAHPPLPKLPVARAVWRLKPDFATACAAWLYAGGSHHTALSYGVSSEQLEDFAEIVGVELVVIDEHTELRELRRELRQSELYYALERIGY